MPRVYKRIEKFLPKPDIIHVVGTNGKGTTGRFLSAALYKAGYSIGHYTSPHILSFNERIWINGSDAANAVLEEAHKELQAILTQQESEALSYFEYTTFLAMLCFRGCDYVVLEAGLGGEYDATAVFEKVLTILTPVDKDHEAFLGENIEEIATTKLGATAKRTLSAKQPHAVVEQVAAKLAKEKGGKIFFAEDLIAKNDEEIVATVAKEEFLPPYLQENLKTAIAALKLLKIEYDAFSFLHAKLFGRLSRIAPNIIVDVGHNPLAARSITQALAGKKFVLLYNSFKDKDYKQILEILRPIVKHVEILSIEGERVEQEERLKKTLNQLKIQYAPFEKIDNDKEYLVFGSFKVVEDFLKIYA